MPFVRKFNYFCVEKYALTEKNEQLFNDIQPIWVLRESSDFCKLCRGQFGYVRKSCKHTFSSRVFYRKYLKCQRVSNSFFYGFANSLPLPLK